MNTPRSKAEKLVERLQINNKTGLSQDYINHLNFVLMSVWASPSAEGSRNYARGLLKVFAPLMMSYRTWLKHELWKLNEELIQERASSEEVFYQMTDILFADPKKRAEQMQRIVFLEATVKDIRDEVKNNPIDFEKLAHHIYLVHIHIYGPEKREEYAKTFGLK